MNNKKSFYTLCAIIFLAFTTAFYSCRSKDKTSNAAAKTETKTKPDSKKTTDIPTKKAPVINIADTIAVKQLVLYIKDSASSSDRISQKLTDIYMVRIPDIIKKNKLKATGSPIAWYRSQKAPFFFEAGIPVDKKPAVLPKGFFVKNIGGDSAVVAHFFGPYDITPIAYETLNDVLKSKKKQRSEPPYEIYVGETTDKNGKKIDPYKVQTDIIFPYKR